MPTYCSAFGCTNSSGKDSCRSKGISFHKFPLADKILLSRWVIKVRRADFLPTPYSSLCSDHFTENDFVYQPFTNRRGLKKDAVPTKFNFNPCKRNHKRKQGKKRNPEMCDKESSKKPALVSINMESDEIQMGNSALEEIFTKEEFHAPQQIEALSMKQKNSHALRERKVALKKTLHDKILLNSLKKQMLNAEIKTAIITRDYYEIKKAMLCQTLNAVPLDDISYSLQFIKTRLKEEKIAAQIEKIILQKQLEEVQMHAANNEEEYYEAKIKILSAI